MTFGIIEITKERTFGLVYHTWILKKGKCYWPTAGAQAATIERLTREGAKPDGEWQILDADDVHCLKGECKKGIHDCIGTNTLYIRALV